MPEQPPPPPVQVTTIEHRVDYGRDPMRDLSMPDEQPPAPMVDDTEIPRGGQEL